MDTVLNDNGRESMHEVYLAYRAEWRHNNKESVRRSNEKYYKKLKEMKILAQASEILAQRQKEKAEFQELADKLATKAPEMRGETHHE